MRPYCYTILCCLCYSLLPAQIPNASFEKWKIVDGIEVPEGWKSNNFFETFIVSEKVPGIVDQKYALQISSRSLSVHGFASGNAFTRFLPTQHDNILQCVVRVDSVDQGSVEIELSDRVNHRIGHWKSEVANKLAETISIPFYSANLDSVTLVIRANNTMGAWNNSGYSILVVDELQLNPHLTEKPDHFNLSSSLSDQSVAIELREYVEGRGTYTIHSIVGVHKGGNNLTGRITRVPTNELENGIYALTVQQGTIVSSRLFVVQK